MGQILRPSNKLEPRRGLNDELLLYSALIFRAAPVCQSFRHLNRSAFRLNLLYDVCFFVLGVGRQLTLLLQIHRATRVTTVA